MKTDNQGISKFCHTCGKHWNNSEVCPNCGPGEEGKKYEINKDRIVNCEFEYECPLKWEDFKKSADENIRFCNSCQKNVYFVDTQTELNKLAGEGKCVALDLAKKNKHPFA